MLKKLIVYLIRRRLGLKLGERFQFTNQHSICEYYYFTDSALMKIRILDGTSIHTPSGVSLNWLLSDKCEIRRGGENEC